MTREQAEALRQHFLAWSGGLPPDSPFEIFAYSQLAMPSNYDDEASSRFLKGWMEQAWKEDAQIDNPKDSFRVFLPESGLAGDDSQSAGPDSR